MYKFDNCIRKCLELSIYRLTKVSNRDIIFIDKNNITFKTADYRHYADVR